MKSCLVEEELTEEVEEALTEEEEAYGQFTILRMRRLFARRRRRLTKPRRVYV